MGEGVSKRVVLIIMYDHLGKLSATIWRSIPPMAGGFPRKYMEMGADTYWDVLQKSTPVERKKERRLEEECEL